VQSEYGKGAIFTIQVPYSKKNYTENEIVDVTIESKRNLDAQIEILSEELSVNNDTTLDNSGKINSGNKPVLLIVEDNHDLRAFMAASLNGEYLIYEAENGKQGLNIAANFSPDLVISDIMMPEMDGLELCSRLKENIQTSHIPVILLTARSTVDNWVEGFETGADDYIAKPFNFEILRVRIGNLIESRRELKKLYSNQLHIDPAKIVTTSADEQFLRKAIGIVEEQFNDPGFGVEKFIDLMAVSRSLLHKKLSALTDQSAGDFITTVRLKKSILYLKERKGNISEIAYLVGFNDPKYFSRIFKKHFGVTPSEYYNSAENQVGS
jgi:YesN/AraC family two-component response regulator